MTASALQDFRDKKWVDHSVLLVDFLKSPGARKHAPVEYLKQARIYEFDWGFIAEAQYANAYAWELYVKEVWRTGTKQWFDRFLTAYMNLARKIVDEKYQQTKNTDKKILIVHDDGISNWSALSFATMVGATEVAREYFADKMLGEILPDLIGKALDSRHKFAQEWCCA